MTGKTEEIKKWITSILNLPEEARIELIEKKTDGSNSLPVNTVINVQFNKERSRSFTISKPLNIITRSDISAIKNEIDRAAGQKHPILSRILRLFGLWTAFTGFYAVYGICPCCGLIGCPVGIGSAGIVSGVFALGVQNWKTFIVFIKSRFKIFI